MTESEKLKECIRDFVEATGYVDQNNTKLRDARNRAAELVPDIVGYPNSITRRHETRV